MTDKNPAAGLPASVQSALDEVNVTRNAWIETRRKQESAASQAETIRQRRAETEANATAQNDEWRRLFRENGGVMTPEMKKLRAEVVLDRESLEEFDALLALHAQESKFLPWETADSAHAYINAHNDLVQLRAMQLWQEFMQSHGEPLIQTLSLLKITLGREASITTGVVRGVNDPESILREFINKHITRPALERDALPEEDAAFRLAGVFPDHAACIDFSRAPTPAARNKMLVRREMAKKKEQA
ncbi:phage polarity suppression protein [Pantoea dispersa]|uniref:phage polarity suppression protein n=1 Tax=Pantoea dispersa TaxID=59814 RepID=UPI0021C95304|nr:septation initiation protein [Pantoea dispersa]